MQSLKASLDAAVIRLSAIGRARDGGALLMFALVFVPLLIGVGAAIDMARLNHSKTALTIAADAAVLTAAAGLHEGSDSETTARNRAEAVLRQQFTDSIEGATISELAVNVTAEEIVVTAAATLPTTFLRLAGIDDMSVTAEAAAGVGRRRYIDFHFVLDTSESMGLAADGAARASLRAATSGMRNRTSCEFACHVIEDSAESQSRLDLARSLGLQLRMDAAKDGIRTFMELAGDHPRSLTPRYSLSAFNQDVYNVTPLTANKSAIESALNGIDVAYRVTSGFGDSFFDRTATRLVPTLGTYSGGITPTATESPYVVIVADGVQSGWGKVYADGGIRPFDQSVCNAYKSAGYRVAVVYLKYYPIPTDGFYNVNVAPIIDNIEPNMRDCASSPELFAVGDTPAEIHAAFATLFSEINGMVMLTR